MGLSWGQPWIWLWCEWTLYVDSVCWLFARQSGDMLMILIRWINCVDFF